MNSFIRKFYDSNMCEAGKDFVFSEETENELRSRITLRKRLEEKLDKDGLELLAEYLDTYSIVKDEEIFHAYVCGMKDMVRFVLGAFTA